MKQSQKNYKRIVVKVGSSLFYSQRQKLDFAALKGITEQLAALVGEGKEIIVVSSGAIALGMHTLKQKSRPGELSYLQAIAALGQNELMNVYRRLLKAKKLHCAQVLLTAEDFSDRKRYLNAKNTLLTLLKLKSIPVINENDTVSTDEIKFGDNDQLSALVATLVNADLLIILSDVDGLLDKDKKLIKVIPEINSGIKALALNTQRGTSVGGMITKLRAAKIVVDCNISCLIANGRTGNIVAEATKDPFAGGNWTVFLAKGGCLAAKKQWLAFSTRPAGKIVVDDGARNALLNKKSLLCVGVVGCQGNFESGDIVGVIDRQNREFARGKARLSSKELEKLKGQRHHKEIIHCDNIVIL